MNYDIVALFCCIDDFCKIYEDYERHRLISGTHQRMRETTLKLSEMLTIMVVFQYSPCKNFKYFYKHFLPYAHKRDFSALVSYERFVQLMPRLFIPFTLLLHCLMGEKTGIYIADSTTLPLCHNKRIRRHKVFQGLAQRGKSTMGWFYGFKLHLIINDKRQIVVVKITPGNVDDRSALEPMTKGLKGKIFADKGYLGKDLFQRLYKRGLKLITGIKRNMKNYLTDFVEKILLRKRFIVETLFGQLKIDMNLTHTRSRSPINFFVNVLSCLTAYQLKKTKTKNINMLKSYP